MTDSKHQVAEQQPRRPYQKPAMVVVSLRPEEAVLGGCKVNGASDAMGANCGGLTPCTTIVS